MTTSARGSLGSDRQRAVQRQSAGVVKAVLVLAFVAAVAVWGVDRPASSLAAEGQSGEELKTARIVAGDLSVDFLDNSNSPKILSGVDRLLNTKDAPGFDAFDPNDPGSSAGLNYEHIISGHSDPANWFAPRNGTYKLYRGPAANSVVLARKPGDDPWALESSMTYTVTAPHYIDFEFRCRTRDARRFGNRGYAVLFWADYMNDVEDVALHFRGVSGPGAPEQWIAADAPRTHPDYIGGGTYRSLRAPALEYDSGHNLKLNMWSYEYPRFTRPFYYGRAAHGMTLMLMFDRMYRAEDEIRFSLFKFKVGPQVRRPAWDFQYVIHRVETGKEYGYRGRLVWRKFVSPEDCLHEYETWAKTAPAAESRSEASGREFLVPANDARILLRPSDV
jgi:hypothetical protein